LGTKNRFRRTVEAVTAACPSGSMHSVVAQALASPYIASVDAASARCLPALISSGSLPGSVLWLSTIILQLDGADWPFSQPPTHYLKPGIVAQIVLRGIEAVHPVQCDASRRVALSGHLRKMHRIRPRSRCIPRFHLPLKGYPWRLVVSEGHLDHRWGTLVSTGHLRVGLPKRFGSGSRASVGASAEARWRIARTGGWAAAAGLR